MTLHVESDIHDHLLEPWLATDEGLDNLVERFLEASLSPHEWTHRAHLGVACALVMAKGTEATIDCFREVIPRLHSLWAGSREPGRGYHETLTVFWIRRISVVMSRLPRGWSRLDRVVAIVEAYGDLRRLDRAFYTVDVAASDAARVRWLAPDLADSSWPMR
jgi:hypothetical protein